MASFDMSTFLALKGGTARGTLDALGMTYGVPSCLLNLTQDVLSILPTSILNQVSFSAQDGKNKADEIVKGVFRKLLSKTGIIEFDTESGSFKFLSDTSFFGIELDEVAGNQSLGALVNLFEFSVGFGSEVYVNYKNASNQINAALGCLQKFKDQQEFKRTVSANKKAELFNKDKSGFNNLLEKEFGAAKEQVADAQKFISSADRLLGDISSIIQERKLDPNKEPCFIENEILDITDFCQIAPSEFPPDPASVFRLEFGPPKSTNGKFLLTVDGIYFDSQSGGLDPALEEIITYTPPDELAYLFDHEPAAGGKGVQVTKDDLTGVINKMFDEDFIDETLDLQNYYDQDHLLQALNGQKNKEVFDLSSQISQLITDEGEDSAIVTNIRESMYSIISKHNSKINRRKKQIELAVRIPNIFDPEGIKISYPPGEIPINDFSYLGVLNVDVNIFKQENLVFKASDVVGIIKPIVPKFVVSRTPPEEINIDNLYVANVGKGGIIHSTSTTTSSTEPNILSLNDQITTNGLVAVYNFLECEVSDPSSTNFSVLNCAGNHVEDKETQVKFNAKLLAEDPTVVFVSGLGIPYLNGLVTVSGQTDADVKYIPSSLGQAIVLPDEKEFRNLAYSRAGFTFESWAHLPSLDAAHAWTSEAFGITNVTKFSRILLGCENVGLSKDIINDRDNINPSFNTSSVRGLLIGFSSDKRIVSDEAATQGSSGNKAGLQFFIAPTQAIDASNCSFINNTECQRDIGYYKMIADPSTIPTGGSSSLGDVSAGFVLISTSFDVPNDEIRIYADGVLVETSSISSVFGTEPRRPINVPSFTVSSSFEYGGDYGVGSSIGDIYDKFSAGPELNKGLNYSFTPWVLGGGYTDGICTVNNEITNNLFQHGFMGAYGGDRSGLDGYVGSVKFYNRALSTVEVLKNFNAQKGFFKNIQI
jgi:hypothetical protein